MKLHRITFSSYNLCMTKDPQADRTSFFPTAMEKTASARLNLRIKPEQMQAIADQCEKHGLSTSEILKQALDLWFAKYVYAKDPPAPPAAPTPAYKQRTSSAKPRKKKSARKD